MTIANKALHWVPACAGMMLKEGRESSVPQSQHSSWPGLSDGRTRTVTHLPLFRMREMGLFCEMPTLFIFSVHPNESWDPVTQIFPQVTKGYINSDHRKTIPSHRPRYKGHWIPLFSGMHGRVGVLLSPSVQSLFL